MSSSIQSSEPSAHFSDTTRMVRQAIVGDDEGVQWIVSHFDPALHVQARYRLKGALREVCDPTDLVNDVWLICLPNLGRLQPRDDRLTPVLVKFLATTLLNRCNTLMRNHLNRRPVQPNGTVSGDLLGELPSSFAGTITQAIRIEQSSTAHAALDRLTDADREIIVLRAVEQVPNHVAAMHIGVTPNTAAVRFKRAMTRLRELVSGTVFDDLDQS